MVKTKTSINVGVLDEVDRVEVASVCDDEEGAAVEVVDAGTTATEEMTGIDELGIVEDGAIYVDSDSVEAREMSKLKDDDEIEEEEDEEETGVALLIIAFVLVVLVSVLGELVTVADRGVEEGSVVCDDDERLVTVPSSRPCAMVRDMSEAHRKTCCAYDDHMIL